MLFRSYQIFNDVTNTTNTNRYVPYRMPFYKKLLIAIVIFFVIWAIVEYNTNYCSFIGCKSKVENQGNYCILHKDQQYKSYSEELSFDDQYKQSKGESISTPNENATKARTNANNVPRYGIPNQKIEE